MENIISSETINKENINMQEKKSAIIFKESKAVAKKMFGKAVKLSTVKNKIQIKSLPMTLKVVSIFVPEAAPVLLPLSNFLKTEAGKTVLKMGEKNQDIINEFVNGDKEIAKTLAEENMDTIMSDNGTDMLKGTKKVIDEMKNISKGMAR